MHSHSWFRDRCALKRIIERGGRGDAKATALNPSQARPEGHAENEREGTLIVEVKFSLRTA